MKLFCVLIEAFTKNRSVEILPHHTICEDSTKAFENTKEYCAYNNIEYKGMSCTIVSRVDGHNIKFEKIENYQ